MARSKGLLCPLSRCARDDQWSLTSCFVSQELLFLGASQHIQRERVKDPLITLTFFGPI